VFRRATLVGLSTLACCGDRQPSEGARKSPVETAIARDLTAKIGQPVTTTCLVVASVPTKCEAALADGTKVPIQIESAGNEWAWKVGGLVVDTAPIVAHIRAALGELNVAQQVNCGGRTAFVETGSRLACKLSGGGTAFVGFRNDGTTSLELDLDAASAAARGELVTPERDRELTSISKALEALEGE
jgi:hypothetical protein